MTIHDARTCLLGEGALWHPEREEFFWFDILGRRLLSAGRDWAFADHASAAGWVDRETLLVATGKALVRFDLSSGAAEPVAALDADDPGTRPNDGRADPQGGFWIGTMGLHAEDGRGAIWRYHKGEVRCLYPRITIPNSICFAPDGGHAYFCDTPSKAIQRVRLDRDGWPAGEPETAVDLRGTDFNPDGSVIAADGTLWNAQWGAGRVAVYDTAGREIAAHAVPASQTTCPAFGGPDLSTLFVTSAAAGLSQDVLAETPHAGRTFALQTDTRGQAEPRVLL